MQRINLRTGLPSKQKPILSFDMLKIVVVSWVLLLVGVYLILLLFYLTKPYTLYKLEKERASYNKVIMAKSKEKQLDQKGIQLEKEVTALKNTISDKKKILTIYKGQRIIKFSDYLKAFSLLTPDDVWLTTIELKPKKMELKVEGYTLSPTLAITFLHELEADPLFNDYKLKITQMKKLPKKDFIFTINTYKDTAGNAE